MKKLIMFLMVVAISFPALATIEDLDPPQWGGTQPAATLVYQLEEDGDYEGGNVEPSCLSGSDDFILVAPGGSWADGVLTTEGDTFFALAIPEGTGENITIQVQAIITSGSPAEYIVDLRGEEFNYLDEVVTESPEVSPLGDDLYVFSGTMAYDPDAVYAGVSIIGTNNVFEGVIVDVLVHDGDAPDIGGRSNICFEQPVFVVDPNVLIVYETGETEGDFDVSLYTQPKAGDTITVTIDPNSAGGGPNEDLILFGGNPTDGSITLTFDANDYDVPQTVAFKAIDDDIAEPPSLLEPQPVIISSSSNLNPGDPNWVGEMYVGISVMDNDQANILFSVTKPRGGPKIPVTGPVQLWEQGTASDLLKWRKIFFKMQVKPVNDADPCNPTSVKVNAVVEGEVEGDNLPTTDPCLPLQEADDPNCFTFTSTTSSNETGLPGDCPDWNTGTKTSCWDVPQPIKIWGNDDDVLQVAAFAEGDQNYQAILEVYVMDDGGDERYTAMERTVQILIEDNECGAYGLSYLDIGNPNAATDPNYLDEEGNPLPDCHVDVYDVIEFVNQWLDCSDPKDENCISYLE